MALELAELVDYDLQEGFLTDHQHYDVWNWQQWAVCPPQKSVRVHFAGSKSAVTLLYYGQFGNSKRNALLLPSRLRSYHYHTRSAYRYEVSSMYHKRSIDVP